MAEVQSDKTYAFTDDDGAYVLDILNSRTFRTDSQLEDMAAAELPAAPPAADYKPLDYMRAQLCVTHACNLNCLYCKLDGDGAGPRVSNMDPATARKAVHAILSYKPPDVRKITVSLTSNGETLINYDLVEELISYCDQIGVKENCSFSFNFATNGTLLSKPLLERILRHDNLAIFFSLDGSEAEQDRLRPYANGGASYRDVLSAVDLYARQTEGHASRQPASSTVITTHNLDIPAIFRHLIELGFRNILTRPVRGPAEWEFALNSGTLEKYKDAYTRFYHFLNQTIDGGHTLYVDSMTPAYDFFAKPVYMLMLHERRLYGCPHSPPAGTGFTLKNFSLTYDADGTILCPCRDVIGIERFRVGSLAGGIENAGVSGIAGWNCESKPECARCWTRYLCGGGCYLQSFYAHEDITRPDAVVCELTRHVARLAMKFVAHLEEAHGDLHASLKERAMSRLPWHSIYGR